MEVTALSREAVKKMEAGPEMDALVARTILGCKVRETGYRWQPYDCGCRDDAHSTHEIAGNCHDSEGLACDDALADFSTDIAAAWEVVEKMRADFGRVEVAWDTRGGSEPWRVGLGVRFGTEATAETAPLAICRAALLATL